MTGTLTVCSKGISELIFTSMVDWPIHATFVDGTNLDTALANSSAFWTMIWSFPLLKIFYCTMDLQLPPTPSTMPFPCEVAKNFQVNSLLYFSVNLRRISMVYLFLNSELGPSVHIASWTSWLLSSVNVFNKNKNWVFIFLFGICWDEVCFTLCVGNGCSHKKVDTSSGPKCTLYLILVHALIHHCKIHLEDSYILIALVSFKFFGLDPLYIDMNQISWKDASKSSTTSPT